MKRIVSFIVVLGILSSMLIQASAYGIIIVKVDGEKVTFKDAQPYIDSKNRTQVPISFIALKLGADVSWDKNTNTVTIKTKGYNIILKPGESKATVNGQTKTLDTTSYIRNSRTYVPISFIIQTLGYYVAWSGKYNTVQIFTTLPADTIKRLRGYKMLESDQKTYADSNEYVSGIMGSKKLKEVVGIAKCWAEAKYNFDFKTIGDEYKKSILEYDNINTWATDKSGEKIYTDKLIDMFIQDVKNNQGVEEAKFITDISLAYSGGPLRDFTVRGVLRFKISSPTNLKWKEAEGTEYGKWYEQDMEIQLAQWYMQDYTLKNYKFISNMRPADGGEK